MLYRWKRYCSDSPTLASLTLTLVAVWLAAMLSTLLGRWLHFADFFTLWLTLPSQFDVFLTRPWTLVTYMAVHFDFLHMLFNVLWLYWFGNILLITLADRHLAYYFIGGGVAGGVFFLVWSALGPGGGWLCGASAAVIAVMCGAAFRLPDHEINLFLIGSVRLKWVALICCVLTFLGGGGNQAAHVGGLAWGLATALMIRNGFDPASRLSDLFRKHGGSGKSGDRRRSPGKMIDALQQHRNDTERLDQLIDKIRISGYGSLSARERKELNELSKRLQK